MASWCSKANNKYKTYKGEIVISILSEEDNSFCEVADSQSVESLDIHLPILDNKAAVFCKDRKDD